jgi:hypothetical protein
MRRGSHREHQPAARNDAQGRKKIERVVVLFSCHAYSIYYTPVMDHSAPYTLEFGLRTSRPNTGSRDGNLIRKPKPDGYPTWHVRARMKILTRGCNPHSIQSFAGVGAGFYFNRQVTRIRLEI